MSERSTYFYFVMTENQQIQDIKVDLINFCKVVTDDAKFSLVNYTLDYDRASRSCKSLNFRVIGVDMIYIEEILNLSGVNKTDLANYLKQELEHRLPVSGLNSGSAERLARLYKFLGKPEASQRYFNFAIRMKETILLASKLHNGIASSIRNYGHLALLSHYAGDKEKAELFSSYVITEATSLLNGPESAWTYELLEVLIYVCFLKGSYSKANHYISKLEELCSREKSLDDPELQFPPTCHAIKLMTQAQVTTNSVLANQVINDFVDYIKVESIPPYGTGNISEWDILEELLELKAQISNQSSIFSSRD